MVDKWRSKNSNGNVLKQHHVTSFGNPEALSMPTSFYMVPLPITFAEPLIQMRKSYSSFRGNVARNALRASFQFPDCVAIPLAITPVVPCLRVAHARIPGMEWSGYPRVTNEALAGNFANTSKRKTCLATCF